MLIRILKFSSIFFLLLSIACSSDVKDEITETCNKVCNSGYVLNSESCKCELEEVETCNKVCPTGTKLNMDSCECEREEIICTEVCEDGFFLNKETCECLEGKLLPLSDYENMGNWVLRQDISDEFEAAELDENRWHIQGKGGVYVSNFIGRAPSEFSINNVQQEDGKLKIISKWEPGFDFNKTRTQTVGGVVYKYENITTAALVGKRYFKYGYMEIKSKSANAPVTSSFWTTTPSTEAHKSELDMFETFGGHKTNDSWRKRLKYNAISWDPNNKYYLPDGQGPAYTTNIQVPHNTADGFHVYGFEWTPDYIKVYIDGVLHSDGNLTKALVTKNGTDPERWVTDVDYKIWLDSETFPWLGLPTADDLPATYEIEYVRVWQKD